MSEEEQKQDKELYEQMTKGFSDLIEAGGIRGLINQLTDRIAALEKRVEELEKQLTEKS